jgi:DNA invertase Pin-like site-specific DNA recombinase
MSNTTSIVAYYRVSTAGQGASGLGLDGQRAAVEWHAANTGCTIAKAFTEVESGKNADRPQLAAALAHCKRSGARLVVAKLDRLARNVHFLSGLMAAEVDFVAVDNPNANKLTTHIMMAVAEAEAAAISERTKTALAAAKQRGVQLGSARPGHWDGREAARLAGAAKGRKATARVNRAAALARVADLKDTLTDARAAGKSLATIADELNAAGHCTPRGGKWGVTQVVRALQKVA